MRHPLAIRLYGIAAVVFGAAGLRWAALPPTWRPIAAASANQPVWAVVVALVVLIGGGAVQFRRTTSAGLLLLALAYGIAALLWLERLLTGSVSVGYWLSFAEALALFLASIAAHRVTRAPVGEALRSDRALTFLFGACVMAFGLSHFAALKFTAGMVPGWIPPNGLFWAVFTGIAHIAAGIAIAAGVWGLLAARLLTAMILAFGVLLWLPVLIANPHAFGNWANNADNFALAGAAWIVADLLRSLPRRSIP